MQSTCASVPLATTSSPICPAGHALTVENTYRAPRTGWRQCKACRREHQRALRARRRAERPPKPPGEAKPPRRWVDRSYSCANGHVYPSDAALDRNGKRICLECRQARRNARTESKWYAVTGERKSWSEAVRTCRSGHVYPPDAPRGSDGRRLCPQCQYRGPAPTDVSVRLWRRVRKGARDDCWPWLGATNERGYGVIRRGGRARGQNYVHRVAWEIEHGPIPPGLEIDHLCGTRGCVNSRHMALVTRAEHMRRHSHH
jgi:hypothetical protein